MSEDFTLTVIYKGASQDFTGRLLMQGYTYKISFLIDQTEVYFERDEEGYFRVISMPGQDEKKLEKIDKRLLQSLKEKLEEVLS